MTVPFTLGLDLGSNSIGWALIDEKAGSLVGAGVRIFPEGVDRDKQGGELPKNQQRRLARGMRRQIARRARRKRLLRESLVKSGLLPPDENQQRKLDKVDPYELRHRALFEKLQPYELGRLLIHLNQRRGFLSNRKTDRSRKKENSAMLEQINDLAKSINASGFQTIGQYLAASLEANSLNRVRGQHTRRDMFEGEFEAIWDAQKTHYPVLLTEKLKYGDEGKQQYPCVPKARGKSNFLDKYGLHGLMFFQRALYWPKSIVGRCELEPKRKRCPRADRVAQRFRLLQEINNLRILDLVSGQERPLIAHQRDDLLKYLERSKERYFSEIRKKLGLLESQRFNLERGERDKLLGMPTDCQLAHKDLFGKAWWELPDSDRNEIVKVLLDDEQSDEAKLHFATLQWGLGEDSALRLLDVDFGRGYSRYSRKALAKLLPSLEAGLPLTAPEGVPCALREAAYLQPHQRVVDQKEFLPQPPDVANPLVRQALHEVRKVINAIIREYGKPTRITIEMAREVKGSAEFRSRISKENRDRERTRDNAAARIREHGCKVNNDAINRYLLWEEQRKTCVYSGKPVSITQLFGGEVEEDHILPYPRSLDNSLMNRVVCFREANARKGHRTPWEWLGETNPEDYKRILQRAECLPYSKARRFGQKSVELTDFFARQFVDTTYITTQVRDYVECLGSDVVCTKGQHTAELRRHWGLNTVLRDDGLDLKNREDHRHHAVDAIVIALTDRSRLEKLARLRKQGGFEQTGEVLSEPWSDFRQEVERIINALNVSHRVQRKIHGALHEETIYGPTAKPNRVAPKAQRPWAANWIEEDGVYVCRKTLESLTLAEVDRIRDERVKELVRERLARFGIQAGRKKKSQGEKNEDGPPASSRGISKDVWKEPLLLHPRKGDRENAAVIKKVRVTKPEQSIRPIRNGTAYVKPGSLHHLCIFEFEENGRKKREAVFVSMIEAAERIRQKLPLIQRKHPKRQEAKFIMSLSSGELILGVFKGKDRLVWFNTAASTQGQLYFVPHHDARQSGQREKLAVMANTLNGRKVAVDPLGRIRWAND